MSASGTARQLPDIVPQLLRWYRRSARDLPWRRTRDPYAIWVSEVMLQQTRVDTVTPYYQRFLRDFPDVRALAAAPESRVLSRWSGLGYYRRARQLHLAAAEVVSRWGGELPRTAALLRELPGVGAYTAAAVASIAFGERAAVVDGNVARVLCRLFAIDDEVNGAIGKKKLWRVAQALVPERDPGDFNQALMELGATICSPRDPACARCPVATRCLAHRQGRAGELPARAPKKRPRRVCLVAAVVSRHSAVLLAERQAGLYGGLWEPPAAPGRALAGARKALAQYGIEPQMPLTACGAIEHALTHRRLRVQVARAEAPRRFRLPAAAKPYVRLAWREPADVPLSALAKKLLRLAGVLAGLVALLSPARARAQAAPADEKDAAALGSDELALYRRLAGPAGFYSQLFGSMAFGRGLRFNNPYRLRTELGADASSLSLTAPYVDLAFGAGFGNPRGFQHGPRVDASFALSGVSQPDIAFSYMALYRGAHLMGWGRLGVSILTAPDVDAGPELGAGLAGFLTGSLAATAEVIGDLFYGAGTYEKTYTVIPVLSFQLGLMANYEVLP